MKKKRKVCRHREDCSEPKAESMKEEEERGSELQREPDRQLLTEKE